VVVRVLGEAKVAELRERARAGTVEERVLELDVARADAL
jgi:hypothetical protein